MHGYACNNMHAVIAILIYIGCLMENVDKKNIGLPSRYINALYELCDEAKNLKKITQDFEKFIKLVEDNKNLNNLLFSPTVGKTNQGKILNDILKKGKADKLTINFCGILCRNGRVNLITKIMREFLDEVARRRGEIVVEVFSPYKLDKKEEDDLKKIILNKTNGKNISLLTHIDSSLLGGLIVKYGSKMIDTSIRTKLNNLELAMKGAN